MRAPDFWSERSLVSDLLAPVGAIVNSIAWVRAQTASPEEIKVPVICVGNLVSGGAGKTPVALSLAKRLQEGGSEVHFLSRGYGGRIRGPHRVNQASDNADDVGDEALLLARTAPTWVSANRAAGGRLAETNGAQIVLMDDGFQNFSLAKNLSVLVIDSEYGFGNKRVMPAGPLRESISCGCRRADLAVLLGGDNKNVRRAISEEMPVLTANIAVEQSFQGFEGKPVVAFAGIGRPEKFFNTLRALDCNLVQSISFPDHYIYTTKEMISLRERAEKADAVLVTTEKDKIRLPHLLQHLVEEVPVRVVWDDEKTMDTILSRVGHHAGGLV
jgi:tetraacyldisaccharide 4'-kinase